MKKIFKFMPVALAAISLASCNSDDFFGNNVEQEALASLEVTVEEPSVTRANAYPVYDESAKKYSDPIIWDANDVLRVYDARLQKYDLFKFNTTNNKFELKNTGDVEQFVAGDYGYALTGYALSYAGWKQDASTGTPVALVQIPATYQITDYEQGTYTDNEDNTVTTYKALLPLWGPVEKKADAASNKDFKAPLKWLTAYAVAQFNNGATGKVTAVRARSLKWTGTLTDAQKKKLTECTVGTQVIDGTDGYATYVTDNDDAPLCGWFEAQLKTNGQMVDTDDPAVSQPGTRSVVTVPVGNVGANDYKLTEYESYVYLPIIPQTYKLLVFEYCVGDPAVADNWYFLRVLPENQVVARGNRIGKMVKTFASISNIVSANTTKAISDEIAAQNTDKVDNVVLNFNYNGTIASGVDLATLDLDGYAELKTITLPKLKCNMTLNIYGTTDLTPAGVTIKDAEGADNKNFDVTFNFIGFKATGQGITLNTTANVTLAGDYTKAGGFTYTKVNSLALGIADATTPLTCTGITDITPVCDLTIGKVAADITVTNNGAEKNAKIITINDDGHVTLADSKATTVNINATPAMVTTSAATVNVKANTAAGKLVLSKGVQNVNIEDAIVADITEDGAHKFGTTDALTISSKGKSAILEVGNFTTTAMTITSSYDDSDADHAKTALVEGNFKQVTESANKVVNIYTAAQLANIEVAEGITGTTHVRLMTNISELKGWKKPATATTASPALNKPFLGNGKTISKIDAPLFASLATGANVSNLTITNATISTTAETGVGALANTAAGTVAITKVSVGGSITAPCYAGGLIGIANGTSLTFGSDNAADKVTSSVTFIPNKTYGEAVGWDMKAGTFGKFVGNVHAGTVEIKKDCVANGEFDKAALKFNYNRTHKEGTITGYFKGNTNLIGYSNETGTGNLTYGEKTYYTAGTDAATLYVGLTYNTTSKTISGTVYSLNDMSLTSTVKTAIGGAGITGFGTEQASSDDTIWNVTFVSHNHYVAKEADVQ